MLTCLLTGALCWIQMKRLLHKKAAEFSWKVEGVAIEARLILRKAFVAEVPCGRTPSDLNCNGSSNGTLPRFPSSDDFPFHTGNMSPRPHMPITTDYRAWYTLKLGSLDANLKTPIDSGDL